MRTIVLVSCSKSKLPCGARAEELYTSPLFRLSLRYARKLKPTAIFILSANYGLVDLDDEIDPYDVTLINMPAMKRRAWAQKVTAQLNERFDLQSDHFVLLAGEYYIQYLLSHIVFYDTPLHGLSIGRRMQFLKRQLENE